MLQVGQLVRVLDPFRESFPDTYEITEAVVYDDGQVSYVLGEIGAFAPIYVELME